MSSREEMLSETDQRYHEIVTEPEVLREATENLLDRLIDDAIRGILFSVHRELHTNTPTLENTSPPKEVNPVTPNGNILKPVNTKKPSCVCTNCGRKVKANGFAPHLQNCMGLGTSRSRSTQRATKNNENSSTSSVYTELSDDEDIREKPKKKKKKTGKKVKPNTVQG